MTHEESLAVIQKMIASSRKRILDDGKIYLLWGIAVSLAAIVEFFWIKSAGYNSLHWIVWPVLMPLAGIATGVLVSRMYKETKVRTHFDEVMSYLWPSFAMMLGIIILMAVFQYITWSIAYPLFIAMYGTATFISGGLLKLKIMQLGAAACWALALISLQFSFDYQLLFLIAAIWVSYMIPGIVLNRKAKVSNV